ncbi:Nmd4p [Lachancea thermotolerans CBS 6340]|uniref:KLTH0D13288p n=1 Tax=Lachancea thermotolerans (strain ATCC 56472 / CBS 6340 / NRRL Y-8284) TaxID=559295 RepID=C5DF94_LACTC|nr:KLTH0D13288p [Lachancea thermotolerans CBS 6340]CAR22849.1 KLTH0D13288p [Lachancea thermotolerans CBS 6340]
MSELCYILDASSLEKGIGNVKRWCDSQRAHKFSRLSLYIPTFTLQELDFLRYRRNSHTAKESLHFIDQTEFPPTVDMIIEFPELLDTILWSDVLDHQGADAAPEFDLRAGAPTARALPRRLRNLLKSCVYKCHLEGANNQTWTLITEDPAIRGLAQAFQIPCCSLVTADQEICKKLDKRAAQQNAKFSSYLKKKSTREVSNGKEVYRAKFDQAIYAPRGAGELWSP